MISTLLVFIFAVYILEVFSKSMPYFIYEDSNLVKTSITSFGVECANSLPFNELKTDVGSKP